VLQQRELRGKSREEGPARSDQLRNFGPETSPGAVAKYLSGGRIHSSWEGPDGCKSL
jgi:hypothetical protein